MIDAGRPATRRVLVTGAAGFIGRHVAATAAARGHHVVSLVRRPGVDVPGTVVVDDLSDPARLVDLLTSEGIDRVVHAAWQGHPRAAGTDLVGQLASNVHPSTNLMVAASTVGVGAIVFLSTGGGQARSGDLHPAYGVSKRLVESFLLELGEQFGFAAIVLRPSAVYGPGQDPTTGLGAVATFARRLLLDEPIRVFGSLANGRDFLHVDDLTRLVLAAAESPRPGVYPAGGPGVVRLDELLGVLEREVGRAARLEVVPQSAIEPTLVALDNSAATDAFGWRPTVTIEAGAHGVVHDIGARLGLSGGGR